MRNMSYDLWFGPSCYNQTSRYLFTKNTGKQIGFRIILFSIIYSLDDFSLAGRVPLVVIPNL